eukprot:2535649-Pleurochrysis_carterae.AAC.4
MAMTASLEMADMTASRLVCGGNSLRRAAGAWAGARSGARAAPRPRAMQSARQEFRQRGNVTWRRLTTASP